MRGLRGTGLRSPEGGHMDKEYRVTSLEYVYLGRSGENLARTVKIDVNEWLDR